jgi:hypothetical protein
MEKPHMSGRRWLPSVSIFVVAATVTSLFYVDLCNLVFRCGCRSLWAGAMDHCNIHMEKSRHCPLCEQAWLGGTMLALVLSTQFLASRWPSRRNWRFRFLTALLLFPAVFVPVALFSGWLIGYWS